jgi:hypothetical protein
MATRKLPAMVLVSALLLLAAVPAGLACKRHYRRAVHHCVVHKVVTRHVACRHYRRGGGLAKPYLSTLATLTDNTLPAANVQTAQIAPPEPWPPLNIEAIQQQEWPPYACCTTPCCNTCNTCCDEGSRHGRRYLIH